MELMGELQFQKDVNASKFLEELKERGLIDKIEELRTKGDQVFVVTKEELTSAEQMVLESAILEHQKENRLELEVEIAEQKIILGIEILSELSVALRKIELPQNKLKEAVERFSDFQRYLYGGHFDLANEALCKITIDELIPQDLVDHLSKKLQSKVQLTMPEKNAFNVRAGKNG
jgi:sRNA-binding protein